MASMTIGPIFLGGNTLMEFNRKLEAQSKNLNQENTFLNLLKSS
jgi:hypothetical protein